MYRVLIMFIPLVLFVSIFQVWYLLGWLYHITNQDSSSIRACLEKAEKVQTKFVFLPWKNFSDNREDLI